MKKNLVDVLVTTMNCKDYNAILKQMNIQSNALIGNQTSYNQVEMVKYQDINIPVYSFKEKGVGLNRNNLLMRSSAFYCLFGDDDLTYVDNYEELVKKEFENYPDADVIVFNLKEKEKTRFTITKKFRVNYFNFMRFGAARIAVKRKSISMNNIYFNQNFGGGCQFSNGEDTIFLADCLKKKMKIYAIPKTIAVLNDDRCSSWFNGYNEKYLSDKGILYYVISKKYYKLLCFQDAFRHKRRYQLPLLQTYKTMLAGVSRFLSEV